MQREQVDQAVRAVVSAVLGREVVPGEEVVRAAVPAWNSLKHIELLFAVEELFGIRLSQDELAALDRLGAIVDRVMGYLESQHSS